jgi:hypothetical protein
MRLSFTIAAGPRQRSHSQVRVPRDSWPHFSVSDSRFPQPGGPGPRIYEYIRHEQGGPVIPRGTILDAAPTRAGLARPNVARLSADWLEIFCYRNKTCFSICVTCNSITRGSRDIAVDIATGYGLDGRGVGVRVPI